MKKPMSRHPVLRLALEPRIVFDAAIAATAADQDTKVTPVPAATEQVVDARTVAPATDARAPVQGSAAKATANSHQLIFIDAAAEGVEQYLQGVQGEVVMVDANRDGVQQILQALAGRNDITGIHIVSHGEPGEVRLGTAVLSSRTIAGYASALTDIGRHMTADADLLIYGCNVAQGEAGQQFVNILAQLTGADVAASVDATGGAALGGNWRLEWASGPIDVPTLAAPGFEQTLNLDVTMSGPATVSLGEDATLSFTGANSLSVDLTSGFNEDPNNRMELSVAHGILSDVGGAIYGGSVTTGLLDQAGANAILAGLRYTPAADYNGVDVLSVGVRIPSGGALEFNTVNITVTPVVDVAPDARSTPRNTPLVMASPSLLANDSFSDPGAVVESVGNAAHGTVSLVAGKITFIPDVGYLGAASFDYTVRAGGVTETAAVSVLVTPSDQAAPVATAPATAPGAQGDPDAGFVRGAPVAPLPAPLLGAYGNGLVMPVTHPSAEAGTSAEHAGFAPAVFVEHAVRGEPVVVDPSLFVQHAVRDEALAADPVIYVQHAVHLSLGESLQRANVIDAASAPEAGSALFDAFGLSAPGTEFVSPVREAERANAQRDADTKSTVPGKPQGDVPAGRDKSSDGPHPMPQRVAATSFSSQLRRANPMSGSAAGRGVQHADRIAIATVASQSTAQQK
ncbi:hypothetical protein BH11PSE7_BH11PSE7_12710 [soil metagenome]